MIATRPGAGGSTRILLICLILLFVSLKSFSQTCLTTNIASAKTTASLGAPSFAPSSNLVDGSLSTSCFYSTTGDRWEYVDLGQAYSLCRVFLKWEFLAYSINFKIQVSTDASSWTDAYVNTSSSTAQAPPNNEYSYHDIDISSLTGTYRYVRVFQTAVNAYEGRLAEVEVYNKATTSLPTVALNYPLNGATYLQGASVTLGATASQSAGTINKVEFFDGTTLLGADSAAPYQYVWQNPSVGSHSVVAKATNNANGTSVSASSSIQISATAQGWSLSGNASTSSSQYLGTSDSLPLLLRTNNAERLRVLADGRVGINTSTVQTGFQLSVNGNIIARKLQITQTGWADFVFKKDYHLPTLEEVEAFTKAHNHLPGIPTAEEVAAKGVDVGTTQAQLLQKIEELTLYMIELNKKVKKLEEENSKLKVNTELPRK